MLDFILGGALDVGSPPSYAELGSIRTPQAGVNMMASQLNSLSRENDELRLVCAALWTVLKTKTGATDQDLVAAIEEADLRDGAKDGKMTPVKAACPKCGRPLLIKRRDICSWCGQPTGLPPM